MRAKIQGSISSLLLAVFLFAAPVFPQGKSVSVPFKFQHGEIVLSVLVDGKPTNLILDTGAVDTAINSKCLNALSNLETMARSADGKGVPSENSQVFLFVALSLVRHVCPGLRAKQEPLHRSAGRRL